MYSYLKEVFLNVKEAYIVGGAVRDLLLGKEPLDIDIVTSQSPEKYAKQLAKRIKGNLFKIGKLDNAIIKVIGNGAKFDISQMKGGCIKEDLKRRDFTINAIAIRIEDDCIIDPFSGNDDIKNRKIEVVSEDIFKNDHIRMIRAYRFAAFYGFSITKKTDSLIREDKTLIRNTAGERIKNEFFKILEVCDSYLYIMQMAESGLLFSIFHQLSNTKPDIFSHTIRSYNFLEKMLNDNLFNIKREKALSLKFAILLHDIGKPDTKKIDEFNRVNFEGHDAKGAEIADYICRDLKMSSKESRYIDFIIRNHLKALYLKSRFNEIAKIKFYIECGDKTPALLIHTIADILGKNTNPTEEDFAFKAFALELYNDFINVFSPLKALPSLITGDDLIKIFGLKPSPLFKKALLAVEEARLTKKIKNREEALLFAAEIIEKK